MKGLRLVESLRLGERFEFFSYSGIICLMEFSEVVGDFDNKGEGTFE